MRATLYVQGWGRNLCVELWRKMSTLAAPLSNAGVKIKLSSFEVLGHICLMAFEDTVQERKSKLYKNESYLLPQ